MSSEIKISAIESIVLGPNEYLAVKMPNDTNRTTMEIVQKMLERIFEKTPGRVFLYRGDVKFTKIEVKDE